jgi:hypothetical protein
MVRILEVLSVSAAGVAVAALDKPLISLAAGCAVVATPEVLMPVRNK